MSLGVVFCRIILNYFFISIAITESKIISDSQNYH
jgi:hypothetical protein